MTMVGFIILPIWFAMSTLASARAVAAKALNDPTKSLPGHIVISAGGSGGRSNDAAYLGPEFASISMGNGKPPQNTLKPEGIEQ